MVITPNSHSTEHPSPQMTLFTKRALLEKLTEGKNKLNLRRAGLWIKKQFVLRGLASFALFAVLLPTGLMPIESTKTAEAEVSAPVSLKLDTSKDSVIVSDQKLSQIVPGESADQKVAREKDEAEKAALAADLAAKVKPVLRNTVSRERRVYADPSNFDEIYNRAGTAYGVDPRILRAIHQVETGGSGSTGITNRSGSGAQGPMQFLPSTFRRHGVDGNGDGFADINNVEDAIFSAAAYLKACGYPNVQKALWGYNPSTSYVNKVMRMSGM